MTGMKSRSAPAGVWPPQRLLSEDSPASSSSLFVTGEVHERLDDLLAIVPHVARLGRSELKPPLSAIQSSPRLRHCSPSVEYAEPVQFFW